MRKDISFSRTKTHRSMFGWTVTSEVRITMARDNDCSYGRTLSVASRVWIATCGRTLSVASRVWIANQVQDNTDLARQVYVHQD